MKRLLFLSPVVPYPAQTGGNIRIMQLCRRLAADYEIHLLPSYGGPPAPDQAERLREEAGIATVHWLDRRQRGSLKLKVERRIDLWRDAPHGISLAVDPDFADTLRSVLQRVSFDGAIINCEYMFQYWRLIKNLPVFFLGNDVETVKYRRWFEGTPLTWKQRVRLAIQQFMFRGMERELGRKSQAVFVTSEADVAALQRTGARGRFVVVPNGVDFAYFQPRERTSFDGPPTLLFVGSLFYKPNLEAVNDLSQRIFPLVRKAVPAATLEVVGNPGPLKLPAMAQPADSGIWFRGLVPDIRPCFLKGQVLCCPLRVGSGTRIKILEAMASGTPVVSTAVGAEGIECVSGRDILIAETDEEWVSCVTGLLGDRDRCFELGRAGRRLAEAKYSWDIAADVMRSVMAEYI